jgi:diacylglycerol kinase (ATP)
MKKFLLSFIYAFKGILLSLKERSVKVHLFASFLVIFSGVFFKVSPQEWLALFLAIGMVISAELMNTALEKVCDVFTSVNKDYYKEMGKPKDIGAGAVLVTALTAASVGIFIFGPRILLWLGM